MFNSKFYKPVVLFLALVFVISSCNKKEVTETKETKESETGTTGIAGDNIPEGLRQLLKAYPEFLKKADSNHLYWDDGTVMVYDDGKEKTHEEKIENPDIEDMMYQKYPQGREWKSPPENNFEPGRIRYEPFFQKMYGVSESAVKSNLVTITWLPGIASAKVQVSKINGLDRKLPALSEDLAKVENDLKKFIKTTAGTFNYRKIAGTTRLSSHSYGIAIDINTEFSDYWQWSKNMEYKNQIPMEIVEIFEKHGFIWGGKWYHYDTMHFEYRPELLVK